MEEREGLSIESRRSILAEVAKGMMDICEQHSGGDVSAP